MKKYQRGWIGFSTAGLTVMLYLCGLGLLSAIGGAGYLVYWIATHLRWA